MGCVVLRGKDATSFKILSFRLRRGRRLLSNQVQPSNQNRTLKRMTGVNEDFLRGGEGSRGGRIANVGEALAATRGCGLVFDIGSRSRGEERARKLAWGGLPKPYVQPGWVEGPCRSWVREPDGGKTG